MNLMKSPSKRSALSVITAAWLLFVLSFCLPATSVLSDGRAMLESPLAGWQTMNASTAVILLFPFLWTADPQILLIAIFPLANWLMLSTPLLVLALRDKSAFLVLLLLPCALLPWFLPKTVIGTPFMGFYAWNISFFAMIGGCVLATIAYAAIENAWYTEWKTSNSQSSR